MDEIQNTGGNPIKRNFSIAAIIIFSFLFILGVGLFILGITSVFLLGALLAVGFLFLVTLISLISSNFRKLILKNGRGISNIRNIALSILVVTGVILIAIVIKILS